ncbi:hypothetical protein F5X96DRAFT_217940 [Biscogniauxia mediterranea]|nr:hypothetical protein F5X96DRAFT_217940 [Biscogniauxia mediterranea]
MLEGVSALCFESSSFYHYKHIRYTIVTSPPLTFVLPSSSRTTWNSLSLSPPTTHSHDDHEIVFIFFFLISFTPFYLFPHISSHHSHQPAPPPISTHIPLSYPQIPPFFLYIIYRCISVRPIMSYEYFPSRRGEKKKR